MKEACLIGSYCVSSFKLGSRVHSFYIKDVPNTTKRYKMVLPSHLSPSKLEVLWIDSQFLFCSLDAVQIYKNRSLYFAISLFTLFILAIYYLAVYIHNRLMSLWDHDAFLLYRLEMSSLLLLSSLGHTTIFLSFKYGLAITMKRNSWKCVLIVYICLMAGIWVWKERACDGYHSRLTSRCIKPSHHDVPYL